MDGKVYLEMLKGARQDTVRLQALLHHLCDDIYTEMWENMRQASLKLDDVFALLDKEYEDTKAAQKKASQQPPADPGQHGRVF